LAKRKVTQNFLETMMELYQIEACLDSPNPQERMKAITELRHYTPEVVVPLLRRRIADKEFIIRSFVAIGLGAKQTQEAFEALLELLEYDTDANVRAEAANSLAKYGQLAIPHLLQIFAQDTNWLVRHSILAAVEGNEYPEVLLKLCRWAIEGDNREVKLAAIANLGQLAGMPQASEALSLLLSLASADDGEIRAQVARVLRSFDEPRAKAALLELRHDADYRVVGATLEGLV
jgi:HEAT repeat protein